MSKKNLLQTRVRAHANDLKREKATVLKAKASASKSKANQQQKALKSRAKQQRRALLKKGVKYEEVKAKAEELLVAPMQVEEEKKVAA